MRKNKSFLLHVNKKWQSEEIHIINIYSHSFTNNTHISLVFSHTAPTQWFQIRFISDLNASKSPLNKAPLYFILCLPVWNTWYFLFITGLLCVSLPFIQRNDRNLSSFVPQTGGNVETFMSALKTLLLKVLYCQLPIQIYN